MTHLFIYFFKKKDYHFGERRIQGSGTQPQQIVGKSPYDAINRRDDKANDPFRPSPTYTNMRDDHRYRHSRRGTITSTDNKYVSTTVTDTHQNLAVEEEEFAVVSSSTVDPVPINNKGLGCRMDANRKNLNHSPRQGMVSGSIPSIHKQSGNSDLIRTSLGGTNHANRSSPSHGFNRNPLKHILINPCNPSDNHMLFTSHLRRWQHALPKVQPSEGPIVHWRSLVTPACLPLTTDYVPSSEELTGCYSHYMYTVSASEDANLYQAGDKSLSEHEKTENLLVELLSQRLAQGFQIIFIDSGVSGITKINPKQSSETATSTINGYNSTTTKDILRDSIFNIKGTSPTSATNSANSTVAATTTGGGGTGGVRTSNFTNAALATAGANGLAGTGFGNTSDESVAGKMKRKHGIWWLSMGHQIHQLTFDSSGQNVEVRRYVRKISFDVGKISYHCAIWPKNMDSFRPKSAVFSYPSVLYAWNYLDHLVAGYQEELTDNLRFWRARFIVIPRETLPSNITLTGALHDHLDEEEKRLALFESWIQNIRKSKWLAPEERDELQKYRKREIGFSDLGIKLTTMDPSAFVRSEAIKMSSHTSETGSKSHTSILSSIISQGLSRDSKSKDIALALQDPKEGIRIMDRRWHFRLFTEVFTGTEFVDWIIIQFEDITTREQAVQFGNVLMQRKPPLFLSSTKRHTFLDGNYFYTLHEDFIIDRKKTKSGMALSSSRKTMGDGKEREPSIDGQLHKVSSRSSNTHRHSEFSMSKAMIIEVDPYKKSDRRETAILHYDTIHNPNNCYHFQLNWLGCTAQLVQELLQNWSRQAERCGLKLVEGSMDQAYEDTENDNPFQCPVPIPLAAKPPSVDNLAAVSKIDVPQQFYEIALVRHLDFVLDVEADVQFDKAKAEGIDLEYSYIKDVYKYDQYVHKSGVAFVQIRAGGDGFYWVNNRLYTNHTPALIANRRQPTSSLSHPDALRTKFIEHCKNKAWLIEFWERTHANFLQGIDPNSSDAWVFENSGAIVENDPGNVAQQDACSETTVVDHETSNAIEIQDRTLTQTSSITVTLSSPSAIDTKSPSLTQTSTVNSGSPSEMSNIHDRSK